MQSWALPPSRGHGGRQKARSRKLERVKSVAQQRNPRREVSRLQAENEEGDG